MKIAIFNWRDIKNPKSGGSEIYFHEIAKRWAQNGNKVIWITSNWEGGRKEETIDGIEFIRGGGEISFIASSFINYLKLKEKPDVIIDVENGLPFFTPLFSRKKIFLHIHHLHHEVWFKESKMNSGKSKIIAMIGYLLEKNLMPLTYKHIPVVTLSNSSAEEIKNNEYNVVGIVSPSINKPAKEKKVAKSKEPTILFLNRVKKYKGVDTLISAFLELINEEKFRDAKLIIGGEGDYLDKIRLRYFKNIDKNIFLLGKISEEEKSQLMKRSWLMVNPSFKEGWGIVNVEASYHGLPVIGSNVTGIRDSILNNKTGMLFEYGDVKDLKEKMKILIKDSKLRKEMEKNSKKWSENFNWSDSSDKYLEIINNGFIKK